eukprot:jgi/Picsp_1/6643/NSC_03986-R1_drug metabolite transporter superfamily
MGIYYCQHRCMAGLAASGRTGYARITAVPDSRHVGVYFESRVPVHRGSDGTHNRGGRDTLMSRRYRQKSSEKQAAVLTEKQDEDESSGNSFAVGNALLLGVAFLWGSYTPMLKVLFEMEGGPTPECVAWIRGSLQALVLCSIAVVGSSLSKPALSRGTSDKDFLLKERSTTNTISSSSMFGKVPIVLLAAAEIGLYNSLGTLLQTEGISMSGAIRSAFLVQATVLWTPMLSTVLGDEEQPRWQQWVGSVIALISSVLVTLDQKVDGGDIVGGSLFHMDGGFLDAGDVYILAATVCYSLATVRIPVYAKRVGALELAAGKSVVLAFISSIVVFWEISAAGVHGYEGMGQLLWPGWKEQASAWGLLVWVAVGAGACSSYMHVKGQSMVTATDAQIVFSTVPLWSAILAWVILPNEHIGALTLAGGALMVVAGSVSALSRK